MTPADVEALWARTIFAPVPVRNAVEETTERLARGIRLGVLLEGDQLPPERELAKTFRISRVTLREAIRSLRDAGLVESRRGRRGGTFVAAPPRSRRRSRRKMAQAIGFPLEDVLALRRVVEPGSAALAASRPFETDERAGLLGYLRAATGATPSARRRADSRLHLAIAALGGSGLVIGAVADVQLRLDEVLRSAPVTAAEITHSDAQHAAIVEAILGGRPDVARTVMEQHVDATAARVLGYLG